MSENPIVLKKRGRKPKNIEIKKIEDNVSINSEEEPIIAHLPISLEDVVDNHNEDEIFIKSENELKKKSDNEHEKEKEKEKEKVKVKVKEKEKEKEKEKGKEKIDEEQMLKEITKKLHETEKIFMIGKNVNKVNVYNIKFRLGSKCLWCKNTFDTPTVELPEDYYNNIFYCTGNFCSWNCAKSHNIDLNDSFTWKRESLLNLMYYKTYGEFKDINPAPSWLLLEEYCGILNIDEFRKLFTFNNKDYIVLHPPMITRQLQIEESYKKYSSNKTDTIQDNELVLKRSKPIENTSQNLEKTIGLKKIITSKK